MDNQAKFKAINQFKLLSKDYQNQIKFFYVRSHSILQSTQYLWVKVCNTKFALFNTQSELSNHNEKCVEPLSNLLSQCIFANYENTVWYDTNGCKLLHYFATGISENLSNDVLNAFQTLIILYPPHPPSTQEMTSWHQHYFVKKLKRATTAKYTIRHILFYYSPSTRS